MVKVNNYAFLKFYYTKLMELIFLMK